MQMLVIGLDGASPDLIAAWSEEGALPTFRRLMSRGAWGRLASTIPPLTPPAWTSSVTGQNPGKHGVFDFTRPSELRFTQSDYRHPLIDSSDRRAKTVWEYLNDAGGTAGIVTLPGAYPPTPLHGFMVSEAMGDENDYQTYPKGLLQELSGAVPRWFSRAPFHELPKGDYARMSTKLLEDLKNRFEVLRHLIRRHDADMILAVFSEIDTAQHYFWHFLDDRHAWNDDSCRAPFRDTVFHLYQYVDSMLAQLIDEAGPNTDLVIYSDHGFGPLETDVLVNSWLIDHGFMTWKGAPTTPRMNRVRLGSLAKQLRLGWLTCWIPDRVKSRVPTLEPDLVDIDWDRTRVYFSSLASQSLMLNLRGREPRGIVAPGREYEQIRDEVISGLQTLRDQRNGKQAVAQIHRREEIYHGPYVGLAPDILVQCSRGFQLQRGFGDPMIQSSRRDAMPRSGVHDPDGVALFCGPKIRPNRILQAEITDIAPTLLAILGVPIPDMDGKVLSEVLIEPGPEETSHDVLHAYSIEQEARIRERLKLMGYL